MLQTNRENTCWQNDNTGFSVSTSELIIKRYQIQNKKNSQLTGQRFFLFMDFLVWFYEKKMSLHFNGFRYVAHEA